MNAQGLSVTRSSKLWYHLLTMEFSVLGNHWQISNKTMKTQGENKNKSNEFHEFIRYIADLVRLLYIFHFSLTNVYL